MSSRRPTPQRLRTLLAPLGLGALVAVPGPLAASTLRARTGHDAGTAGVQRARASAPHASFGVVGTAHDLSATGQGRYRTTDTSEVCVFCHTPHGTTKVGLWNRQASGAALVLYGGNARGAGAVGPETLLCLSCHDGTMAFDQLATGPSGRRLAAGERVGWSFQGGPTLAGAGVSNLGTDLRDDHPVSVTYDPSRNPGLRPVSVAGVGGLPLFGPTRDQVECSSCHDPHDDRQGLFLRASNHGSRLCLTCHDK